VRPRFSVLFATVGAVSGACTSSVPEAGMLADELDVGVLSYSAADATAPCNTGPSRTGVRFMMDGEYATGCSHATGDRGEGDWVSPYARKFRASSRPEICSAGVRTYTRLSFCKTRVPADLFKPLTVDPEATEQAYALLMFGDACPPQAIEISKRIVNEDADNQNELEGVSPEEALPNVITGDLLGNFTWLHFCLFRSASSSADTMTEFPDLGFPYAVFHDFEGPQPGWVMQKRFEYSDDSNDASDPNRYYPDPDTHPETLDLMPMIEHDATITGGVDALNTYFDMARVR
jgi:hypothetical protein